MRYVKYLKYLLRHKWFVFCECCRRGMPIRGIMHDMSKFRPSEFFAYANHFYGPHAKRVRDRTGYHGRGYFKPKNTGDADFDMAWLLHQKRNRHHWQWWLMCNDDGTLTPMPMDIPDMVEMLCDWKGAARAQGSVDASGNPKIPEWYDANRDKIVLHSLTRLWIDNEVDRLRPLDKK